MKKRIKPTIITLIYIISMVLILQNINAITEAECRELYPCNCEAPQQIEEKSNLAVLKDQIDLNEIIKEENVSLITIFIDRENNITVLYKAEELVSNSEQVKRLQSENIESIEKEKESKTKKAWRTHNETLAGEAFEIEEVNRDYIKYKFTEKKSFLDKVWGGIISVFT